MPLSNQIKKIRSDPLILLWVCVFIDILGYSMLTPYMPQIMLDMDVPIGIIGLVLSIPPFIGFFTNLLWGSLSDRKGRRLVIIVLRIGTLFSYLVLMVSKNLELIILSRVIAGVFNSVVPVSLTVVNDVVAPEKRSMELSKIGAGWLVGSILGPLIGSWVAESGAFGLGLINLILVALTIIITLFYLKETHVDFKEGSITKTNNEDKPIISVGLLKEPLPRFLLLQSLFNRIPYFMFVTTTSLFVTIRFGFNVVQIGSFFTLISIINLVIRLILFPYVLRKLGDDMSVRLGFSLYLVAFSWLVFANSVWEFAVINMVMSFATSTAIDVMTGVMSHAVKKEEMGEMMGLASAVESITMVVGPIIGSNLLAMANSHYFGLFGVSFAVIPLIMDFFPIRNMNRKSKTQR